MKKTILPERNISPEFMSSFGLEATFDRIGRTPIISLVDLVYTTLVRCFYSKDHLSINRLRQNVI